MNAMALKWDDFRIILAIGKTSSLSGAAKVTMLSHATIFRRLADVEDRLGVKIFWRNRDGYSPTEIGKDILSTASKMDEEITRCQRKISGQDISLEGLIKITTTDTLLHGLLGKHINSFKLSHPKVKIEIVIANDIIDLSQRNADIAIRPVNISSKNIIGQKIGAIEQAIYTHVDNVEITDKEDDLYNLISSDSEMGYINHEKWFAQHNSASNNFISTNSILGNYSLIRSGHGYAILPCYLGDSDNMLKKASRNITELKYNLWIFTHADLRNNNKVKYFIEHMATNLKNNLSLL